MRDAGQGPTEEAAGQYLRADGAWARAYPGAAAGVLVVRGAANPERHAALSQEKSALEAHLRARLAGLSRAELRAQPTLQAYDTYYRRFQKSYHVQLQLESVVHKGRPIPEVASLVTAMVMAELRSLLLTAGHDLAALALPVRLSVAAGDERYTLLTGQEQVLKAGDMFMADGGGVISSVLCGPDQRTRITAGTEDVLFAVYAPPGIGRDAVERHLRDIEGNVRLVAPRCRVEEREVVVAAP